MTEPTRPRCPNCQTPYPAGQLFCGRCGYDLNRQANDAWVRDDKPPPLPLNDPNAKWQQTQFRGLGGNLTIHRFLKWGLALWAIAYPVVSCSPMLATGTDTGGATVVGGLASLVVGAALLGPWIVGLLVLGVLVYVTR